MFNFDDITNQNNTEHNLKWPCIPNHLYRILIIGGSGSGKTNALLNLKSHQQDKIYLYAKDLNEPKCQLLLKRREDAGRKHLNDPRPFIEYANTMDDVYNNLDDYNPKRSKKFLTVFYEIIADMNTNKKFQTIVK